MNPTGVDPGALRVLIVGPTPSAESLRPDLEAHGHAVWTATVSGVSRGKSVAAAAPDVAVVQIPGSSPDAALAAASLLSHHHRVPVVVWGDEFRACLAKRLGGLCPRGVLVEPLHTQQLLATLTVAACIGAEAAEDDVASPAAMRGVLERIRDLLGSVGVTQGVVPTGEGPDLSMLTRREREVLEAFVRLQRIPDVAESLFISKHTVRNHLKSIYAKLGVHSQPELMVLMLSGRD